MNQRGTNSDQHYAIHHHHEQHDGIGDHNTIVPSLVRRYFRHLNKHLSRLDTHHPVAHAYPRHYDNVTLPISILTDHREFSGIVAETFPTFGIPYSSEVQITAIYCIHYDLCSSGTKVFYAINFVSQL